MQPYDGTNNILSIYKTVVLTCRPTTHMCYVFQTVTHLEDRQNVSGGLQENNV
jgi:hypothetical protein